MREKSRNVLRMPEELILDMNEHLPGELTIQDIQRLTPPGLHYVVQRFLNLVSGQEMHKLNTCRDAKLLKD